MNHSICDLRAVLAASNDEAEEFCLLFRRRAMEMGESFVFIAELLLREALTNAIVHGSRGNRRKQVLCAVRLAQRRVIIAVQDEGDGFDWRAVPPEQSLETRGRGIDILRKYASRVRFNNKGNAVTLIVRLPDPAHSHPTIRHL
jgi:anti-sigma regulatory factor (Ser/Thr protein kinase)